MHLTTFTLLSLAREQFMVYCGAMLHRDGLGTDTWPGRETNVGMDAVIHEPAQLHEPSYSPTEPLRRGANAKSLARDCQELKR
ncbi:unnamed protein product [Eruca vesicaria subsp. sativa]|uniref:Uncharacterized protein n=1 Tax=Eruca vesicaria subsp. sativa TaxID=29727 RepID=A0ABC8JFS1_ERUVS|nr:unnamed protein product [Eruca vesicaria subsp. sativa]